MNRYATRKHYVVAPATGSGGSGGNSSFSSQGFITNGIQTVFATTAIPATVLLVELNGILQRLGIDCVVAANSITFGVAPPASPDGTQNLFIYYSQALAIGSDLLDPGAAGFAIRTGPNTTVARQLQAGSTRMSVTNGDGQAGNTVIDIPRSNLVLKGAKNRYYGSGITNQTTTTIATAVGSLKATVFKVYEQLTLDRIRAEVTTLVAASNIRLGIYADDGNGYPGALVVDSGALSGAALGVISANINVVLDPGIYWLVTLSDASITVRAWTTAALPADLGYVDTMGANGVGTGIDVAQAYGALPANFPAGGTIQTTARAMVLVRAA